MNTNPPYHVPYRMFAWWLGEVKGMNKIHRYELANAVKRMGIEMGDPRKITMEDLTQCGAPKTWKRALPLYHEFALTFMPEARNRDGIRLNFAELGREFGLTRNQVKKLFQHFLHAHEKRKTDYIAMHGYLLTYVMPRVDYALFREYLRRESIKELNRTRTYADFLNSI